MLREAGERDLPAVLGLYQQLHPDDVQTPDAARILARIEATPGLRLFVWELDGIVVASTYLNVIPNLTRGGSPYAVIENVVVDAALRGRGIGRQLMAATLARAWAAGCYKVMLLTGSRDPATHAFYRACGFDGEAKTAYLARP